MGFDSLSNRHGTSCPAGQTFYDCESSSFKGCCSSDPCALSRCLDLEHNPNINVPLPRQTTDSEDGEIQLWPPVDETTSSSSSSRSTRTMTDSGITHTIPNDEVVTVTKHTLITTGQLPSPTEPPPSLTGSVVTHREGDLPTPTGSPPTATNMPDDSAGLGGTVSMGAIIGMALGGLAVVIISIVVFFVIKRRRSHGKARQSTTDTGAYSGTVRDDFYDDKHFPAMSPHTTGTQDPVDPFAPFGGRADEPARPPNGAFEMDATTSAPVELPAEATHPGSGSSTISRDPSIATVRHTPSRDPQATLNALRGENGKPAYVNHWDQYRAMGGG